MKVLAIDPGFGRCGIAVLSGTASKATLIYSSCIETSAEETFSCRLEQVGAEVLRLIKVHKPELIAIEEVYFTNNAKTVLRIAEVRGMLIYLAVVKKIPLVEFNPLSIKIALTGYGRSTKEQVTKMVKTILRLPDTKRLDDEYDAIALGIAALAEARNPRLQI